MFYYVPMKECIKSHLHDLVWQKCPSWDLLIVDSCQLDSDITKSESRYS